MKLSKIQQIIKEEVAKAMNEADDRYGRAMDNLKKAVGFQEPLPDGPENVEGLPLEKLPKYQELPDTRKEEDELLAAKKIIKKLYLPSVEDSRASDVISSKEEAQEWVKKFMNKWGLQPGADKIRFGFDAIKNPTVINGSDRYNEWKSIDTDPSQYGRLD